MIEQLAALFALIRRFEGCRLMPYLCPAGVWTCGWGSTGRDVIPGRAWTQAYADQRMQLDAVRFAKGVLTYCPTASRDALCALADFAYNLGLNALKNSTLRRAFNAGDIAAAQRELGKWVNGGGRRLNGLVLRRAAEAPLLSRG